MAVTIWKNVSVGMQSALASALTISAITKASPGVATSAGHGLSDGDYVYLEVEGMWQLDQRVARVTSSATDTFALEGIDTTAFDTFTSGTAKAITFGTTISTAIDVSASGGEFDFIDTTTIHDNTKKQVPGLPSAISYTMNHIWDISDAGQTAMKTASDSQTIKAFKFTFGTGGKIVVFAGYVGFVGLPSGSGQDKVTSPAVITMNGTPTYYSS